MELNDREFSELRRKAAEYDTDRHIVKAIALGVCAFFITILIIVFAWKLVSPQLNLYKANTEKQSQIAQSKAKADAAVYEKAAEITRAEGVAKANEIIASSITDEYIRWLYVDQLDRIEGQIIYIPTEAAIPVLEAGRGVEQVTGDG